MPKQLDRLAAVTALGFAALLGSWIPSAEASGGRPLLAARNDPVERKRPAEVPDDATLEAAGARVFFGHRLTGVYANGAAPTTRGGGSSGASIVRIGVT